MRIDNDGFFRDLNPAWLGVLRWGKEDLLGRRFLDFIHPEDQRMTTLELQRLKEGDPSARITNRFRCKDGSYRVFSWLMVAVPQENCIYAVVQDETERQLLENHFHQNQRMEAMGRLAGGIAHDFNNLLGVILGYTDLMLESVGTDEVARSRLEQIRKAGRSAANLTRQLLAFSRRQSLQPKVLDINEVLSSMEEILRRLLGEDIELLLFPAKDLGRTKVDPGQLEQIILNLAANAREAMPTGGTLTIDTANTAFDDSYVKMHPGTVPGPYVMMAISDTGVGMDAATQARVFEPFFTTKQQGAGLGLATVYGIVKQSGGFIWVYSEPRKGTTFKVYFPRVYESKESWSEAAAPPLRGGTETLLVVEDSDALRALFREFLESGGYQVLDASNGVEALRIAQQSQSPIHALVTDVVMPQMSGRQLAEQLHRFRPGIKVLYVSGYTNNVIAKRWVVEEGVELLFKPFTKEALLQKIRQVLDSDR
ncbi:MAG TPA: ATP-binding protein [Terriglobia bacterium]|nr:ATP-binding protein [Terriglobia bacterium]